MISDPVFILHNFKIRKVNLNMDMETKHKIYFESSLNMGSIPDNSIDLIVTSPPYPMIQMWDDIFSTQDKKIEKALNDRDGNKAFELMHGVLDSVWNEAYRVLRSGGFACINIGDATRTINENFALYPNHTRILHHLRDIGFTSLPDIIWRKQTNAPNKFMGSGMLPAGAYVTLEHEYILVVRKGSKREFPKESEKLNRRQSALFWEERNTFFSDIWFDIKGTRQGRKAKDRKTSRRRSGAFPFELVYRLINMYSVKGDMILDPFMGTGTSMAAAMASARNCIGFEIDNSFKKDILAVKNNIVDYSNQVIQTRLNKHIDFVKERLKLKKIIKHNNEFYGFPVITNQEKFLILNELIKVKQIKSGHFSVGYSKTPQEKYCLDWGKIFDNKLLDDFKIKKTNDLHRRDEQLELF